MDFKPWLVCFILLALTMVAESSLMHDAEHWVTARSLGSCNGAVGDCIGDDEEMLMESEASRRVLAQRRFISYGALRPNNVPCGRRGNSYYNCQSRQRANPYRRSCTRITNCARRTG